MTRDLWFRVLALIMVSSPIVTGCLLEDTGEDGDGFEDDDDAGNGGGGDADDEDTDDNSCRSDGTCEGGCNPPDPDCDCDCDRNSTACDALRAGSSSACDCDPDCGVACLSDDYCDSFCDDDPDCASECECDYFSNVCEAAEDGTTDVCDCDDDCGAGDDACSSDDHCDTFCPDGEDPDCDDEPECSCDYYGGICEAAEEGSTDNCACDADCDGAFACKFDDHCDTWCPDGVDPDCD